jgi:hypothetical protein
MISRLPLLALAGALTLAGGQARAADGHGANLRVIDTYLAITGAASAPAGLPDTDKLAPLDARVVALGGSGAFAVVYYTVDDRSADEVRVVTTVGADADGAAPSVRLVSYLARGQKAEVSIAGEAGTEAASLELAYDGASLTVRPAPARLEG